MDNIFEINKETSNILIVGVSTDTYKVEAKC